MIHYWNCIRCNSEFTTHCFENRKNEKGEFVDSYSIASYRRLRNSCLCEKCYSELENPVFELLNTLEEKIWELEMITSDLRQAYRDSVEKTPERLAAIEDEKKNGVRWRF